MIGDWTPIRRVSPGEFFELTHLRGPSVHLLRTNDSADGWARGVSVTGYVYNFDPAYKVRKSDALLFLNDGRDKTLHALLKSAADASKFSGFNVLAKIEEQDMGSEILNIVSFRGMFIREYTVSSRASFPLLTATVELYG